MLPFSAWRAHDVDWSDSYSGGGRILADGLSVFTLLCIAQGIPIYLLLVWTLVGHYCLCLANASDRLRDVRGVVANFHSCKMGCFLYV